MVTFSSNYNKQAPVYKHYLEACQNAEQQLDETKFSSTEIAIDIATAYFTVKGWNKIKTLFTEGRKIRLILGYEPTLEESLNGYQYENNTSPEQLNKYIYSQIEGNLITSNNDFSPSIAEYKILQEFYIWLSGGIANGNVEIRLHDKPFMHGKTISFYNQECNVRKTILGSANLTASGLSSNIEAVASVENITTQKEIAEWFETIWEDSKPYNKRMLEIFGQRITVQNPETIYMKFLHEYFQDTAYIDYTETINEHIEWLKGLTEFQIEGAKRAQYCLDKYNGVLISDEVGLGKTYIAGALMKRTVAEGKRVLVVAPASIRETVWEKYIAEHDDEDETLRTNVQTATYDNITKTRLGKLDRNPNEYSLIIIDEAHNLRNTNTKRYQQLESNVLQKMRNPRIVFLTATPLNNKIADIHSLLRLFLPDDFMQARGITSLETKFKEKNFIDTVKTDETLHWIWYLLNNVALRRTRVFIRSKYSSAGEEIIINGKPWRFPELIKPELVPYSIDSSQEYREFFEEFLSLLTPEEDKRHIKFAAYAKTKYFNKKANLDNVSLMRTTLLKRLESSYQSFMETLTKMKEKTDESFNDLDLLIHEYFENKNQEIASIQTSLEKIEEELEEKIEEDFIEESENKDITEEEPQTIKSSTRITYSMFDPDMFPQYVADIINDKNLLKEIYDKALQFSNMDDSDKVNVLIKKISETSNKKIVIFTTFTKTASNLQKILTQNAEKHDSKINNYEGKIEFITGSTPMTERKNIIARFTEEDNETPCDILISTDVLAEGVNLQTSNIVIHYDLPWNPMVVVQRVGRVDRIGSPHEKIFTYTLIPEDDLLKKYLSLYRRIKQKMETANKIIGNQDGTGLLDTSDTEDRTFGAETNDAETETYKKELEDAYNIEKLFDYETVKTEYEEYISNPNNLTILETLPKSSGSIISCLSDTRYENSADWVFCLKVKNKDAVEDTRFVIVSEEEKYFEPEAVLNAFESINLISQHKNRISNNEIIDENFIKELIYNIEKAKETVTKNYVVPSQRPGYNKQFKVEIRQIIRKEKELIAKTDKKELEKAQYAINVLKHSLVSFHESGITKLLQDYKTYLKQAVEPADENEDFLYQKIYNYAKKHKLKSTQTNESDITKENIELISWFKIKYNSKIKGDA